MNDTYNDDTLIDDSLHTALDDLVDAIETISLGGVTPLVIKAAGFELISNWNDHIDKFDGEVAIDEELEMIHWNRRMAAAPFFIELEHTPRYFTPPTA